MFYMHDIGWGWWLLMSVGMFAFWALVIYGVVLLLRRDHVKEPEEPRRDRPEEVLERRLAQGDISIDDYERLRETLERRPPGRMAA